MTMTIRNLILVCALMYLPIPASADGQLNQTLKRVNDSGAINLGYREGEPPMSFLDDAGKPVGYSIELCNYIAAAVKKELGRSEIKVNYVPVTAESRFSAIESGEIDILCGATTKTLTRSEIVGFTQLTFVTGATLLSRKDAAVENVIGLKGKRVAVVSNTTTIESLNAAVNELLIDVEVVPVASADEGMTMLDKSEVDAFSSDQVILIGQIISRNGDDLYSLSDQLFSFEPFALALPRGDADFQLVADRTLSQLYRTGQIRNIYQKWFGRFGEKPPFILKALYQLNATPL